MYRSFVEAGKFLSDEQRWKYYTLIFDQMFDFVAGSSDDNMVNAMFMLISPQIEANIKKYENWNKPKGKKDWSKKEAKDKQIESKTEGNEDVYVYEDVNEDEDANVNDNEISSKEDTAIAEYWNKEVNEIISILKEKVKECELIYSADPQDRQYAKHLLSKKFSANLLQFWMTMEEFIGNIVKLSTQPYTKQVNNCKKFYYNRWDVINSSKSWMNKNKTTISHIW